jgi:hypothetical protein
MPAHPPGMKALDCGNATYRDLAQSWGRNPFAVASIAPKYEG